MAQVISMNEFNESKNEATNLTEDEKMDAEMERAMDKALDLFDFITETTGADPEVLFFLWSQSTDTLINALGWTKAELKKEIEGVEVWDEGEEFS